MRQNSLSDTMANLMEEAGCSDVQIEPTLLPVNPNDFRARLDISARGLKSAFERTFFK